MSFKMKGFLFFGAAWLALSIAWSASLAAETRTVADMGGTEVTLPAEVKRIINLWPANNQVVLLLGGADKLIGTSHVIKGLPWYARVYPRIKEVKAFSQGGNASNFNAEEILAAKPDVVIMAGAKDAETLRQAGINALFMTFRDFEGLKETVRVTARVLGPEAEKRAEKFIAYFDSNLKLLSERLARLDPKDRPKIYQIRSANPLETDGTVSICTEWMEAAGGVNAMLGLIADNQATVTMEEVLRADPDYIIVAAPNARPVIDQIKNSPEWASVKAVKKGRVYANPVGTFIWARYSCEEALQVLWVAKLLHPDLFPDIDMTKEIRNFYRAFYDCDLTEAEAERMLAGLAPL